MLLDSYTASFYQSREKLESLVTVKKFELRRYVGILISEEKKRPRKLPGKSSSQHFETCSDSNFYF